MPTNLQRFLCVVGAAACVAAAPEPAPPAVAGDGLGPVLWQDLRVGMTKQQVRALQPKNKVELTAGCVGKLSYFWEGGKLARVAIDKTSDDTAPNCAMTIVASLNAKYGQPTEQDTQVQQRDCGAGPLVAMCQALGGDAPITWKLSRWVRGNVSINMRLEDTDTSPSWTILFDPALNVPVDSHIAL